MSTPAEHNDRLNAALQTGDIEAARVAWYELGRALSHGAYVVLRPWDMPMPAGAEGTLKTLTAWIGGQYRSGEMAATGCVFDAVQAIARAIGKHEEDREEAA